MVVAIKNVKLKATAGYLAVAYDTLCIVGNLAILWDLDEKSLRQSIMCGCEPFNLEPLTECVSKCVHSVKHGFILKKINK